MLLDGSAFLTALGDFYASNAAVKVQFKKYAGLESARKKRRTSQGESFCLVRASSAGKSISAEISKSAAPEFQNRLAALLRANLGASLKPTEN